MLYEVITSIIGTTVLIDNDPQTSAANGRGYTGTSETVALYYRETFKVTPLSSTTTNFYQINEGGTDGSVITYSGGWDTGTTTQDGMTILDGSIGNGRNNFV